jgi:hypothetical protein
MQNKKAAQDAGEDMGSSSAQTYKKFTSHVDQVKTINGFVTSGVLSKKLGVQNIQKIFGIKNGNPGCNKDGTATVYPLEGCCNYAPCLIPRRMLPGWVLPRRSIIEILSNFYSTFVSVSLVKSYQILHREKK